MSFTLLGILNAQAAGGAVGATSFDLLETTILTTNTASVSFTGLGAYSDYKHLQIRYTARTTLSGTFDSSSGIQLNGDTGNNYSSHNLNGSGSTVTSNAFTSQAFMFSQALFGNTAAAGAFGAGVIDFLDSFSTSKNKTLRWFCGSEQIRLGSGQRINTEAITSITLAARDGNSYLTGSRFSLYGIKAGA